MENALEIFSERHRRKRDRRRETDGRGNKSGHEADRGMVNLGKKMIFATGTWKRGTELAVTKRAAKRSNSADDPEHDQRETGLNVGDLKPETGEDAGADDVCNDDPTSRVKT